MSQPFATPDKASDQAFACYIRPRIKPFPTKGTPPRNKQNSQKIQEEDKNFSRIHTELKAKCVYLKEFARKQFALMLYLLKELEATPKLDEQGGVKKSYNNAKNAVDSSINEINQNGEFVKSPYFGRIDFKFSEDVPLLRLKGKEKTFFIGKRGILLDKFKVTDWRAPISSVYYNFPKPDPNCFYKRENKVITGELKLKRKIEIENATLQNIYEGQELTSLVGSDPFLLKQLQKSSSNRLKDIISTIQSDQNIIISMDPTRDIVVQGVAGCGKTSIAVHRLSWLLYNYKDIDPKKCLIIAPNKLFLGYIAEILPEIGSENVPQTTFEDWVHFKLRHIIESETIIEEDAKAEKKSSKEFMKSMEKFAEELKNKQKNTSKRVNILHEYLGKTNQKNLSKYDLPALLYLKILVEGVLPNEKIHYLVVDEAQDHTYAELFILKKFTEKGRTLIVGDIMQGIISKYGITDWEELISTLFNEKETEFFQIKVSYRSTKSIINFVNEKLRKEGIPAAKLPQPVLREGTPPLTIRFDSVDSIVEQIIPILSKEKAEGANNIGIIVPQKYLNMFADELNGIVPNPTVISDFNSKYEGGVVLGYIKVFKGIEFDTTIYVNIPETEDNQLLLKQFYVACTRAMHRLYIFERE